MIDLYRKSTQFMSVIIFPLTGMIALFSTELLFAWSGNKIASDWAGPILFWFALGGGILSISAFQYYLQYAYGKLKMHVIYNSISASIQIPIIIYTALYYGALGVAITWFGLRLITFIIWTPIVHHKFLPKLHLKWLINDVLPVFLSTFGMLFFVRIVDINLLDTSRLNIFITLSALGLLMILVNLLVSSATRDIIVNYKKNAQTTKRNNKKLER